MTRSEKPEVPTSTDNFTHEEVSQENLTPQKQKSLTSKFAWLIPIISLFLVSTGLLTYYYYEKNINEEVLNLQKAAEEAALDGDYSEAVEALNKAIQLRPDYEVLAKDLEEIQLAKSLYDEIDKVQKRIKEKDYENAETQIFQLKEKVNVQSGPLFTAFSTLIDSEESSMKIGMIKQELDDITTIDALKDKLQVIETLSTDDGKEVKEQILTKIVKMTVDNATAELEENQFSDALDTVTKGLEYKPDDEQLLSLKSKIEQEEIAFEQAEQERIEQAMEAAAREDLQNRTAAVEVITFETEMDEYGDVYIYGTVRNVATRGISDVTIYYTLYDADGLYYDEGMAYVYPYQLNPGDQGSFEDIVYFINEEVTVEIDNITWYLH
ncbi:FxLYD domain-containing protein [Oceanobacillus halophilus]|nr:FxLYD domain-containing protein [Oceanobacillus halophilus]